MQGKGIKDNMITNRLILAGWQARFEIMRYLIVGFSTVILDMSTLIFLKEVVKLSAVLAVTINQIIIIFYNFTLNKFWSFKNFSLPHKQFIRYLILTGGNYSFSIMAMYVCHQLLGFDYRLIRLLTITLTISWTFLLYKYWIYAVKRGPALL